VTSVVVAVVLIFSRMGVLGRVLGVEEEAVASAVEIVDDYTVVAVVEAVKKGYRVGRWSRWVRAMRVDLMKSHSTSPYYRNCFLMLLSLSVRLDLHSSCCQTAELEWEWELELMSVEPCS
jgi:hypothetical protein